MLSYPLEKLLESDRKKQNSYKQGESLHMYEFYTNIEFQTIDSHVKIVRDAVERDFKDKDLKMRLLCTVL